MDWSKIMADAGIPDPPGRDELVQKINEPKRYRITYRSKSTGLTETRQIMAKNFLEAFKEADRVGFTFISILEDR
jgi:histidyl-tRNA synthetase